ncbi:hypothetical protein acdb102_14220 [Acidothermaceae bacterium B102]|nr:hypothetical protein acdb102_14220 [Acidothermaceae bacterium B102]
MHTRARTSSLAVVAALSVATLGLPATAQAASSAKPGLVGGRVILQDAAEYAGGFDVAMDGAGNAYIGWIGGSTSDSTTNQVHLCTVHAGASTCAGGIQSVSPISPSTAAGLHVLVTPAGAVTLIWSHNAVVPTYAGRDSHIAESTSQAGSPLSAPVDVADAPTESALYDAVLTPGGTVATVMAIGAGTNAMEVREGVASPPITVATPYAPGYAYLAYAGSTPILAIQKDGGITIPPSYAHAVGAAIGAGFSSFADLHAWTAGANIGLVATKSGVRLVTAQFDSYAPVVAKLSGTAFGKPVLIGDHNGCDPSSHDVGTDASGRVVDISNECGQLAVDNLANTTKAGIVRFSAGGTNAAGPAQIASTPRGHAIAVWAVESPSVGNRLYFGRVLLPGLDTSVSTSGVTVTGPVSCQPASTIAVSVKGAQAGWKVASASLTFGGKKLASKATINGAVLKPGKVYALVGKVVFTKGGVSRVGTATLKFRSCIAP